MVIYEVSDVFYDLIVVICEVTDVLHDVRVVIYEITDVIHYLVGVICGINVINVFLEQQGMGIFPRHL